MKYIFWYAILAALGYGGYYLYTRSQTPVGKLNCPDVNGADFKASLARIASGETSATTAEKMAQGWDNGGCPDAASRIRGAVPKVATPGGGGPISIPLPTGAPLPSGLPAGFPGGSPPPAGLPPAPAGMFAHRLLVSDVEMRPPAFSLLAGFSGISDMATRNGMTISDATVDDLATDPSVYRDSLSGTFKRLSPWGLGQAVFTRTDLGPGYVATSGVRSVQTGATSSFDQGDCMSGARDGWFDVWLGKPPSVPAGTPGYQRGYAIGFQLARNTPAAYLTSAIPRTALNAVLRACLPTSQASTSSPRGGGGGGVAEMLYTPPRMRMAQMAQTTRRTA
jgi:hypothetical protein